MNYRDIIGFGKKKVKKPIKEQKNNKFILSENIKNSLFYDELTQVEQYDLERYIGNEVQISNEGIGFNKTDSMVNGLKVPQKYLIKNNALKLK